MGWSFSDIVDAAESVGEEAGDLASDVVDGVGDLAEEAGDLISDAADLLQQAIDEVGGLADDAFDQIGDSLEAGWEQAVRYVDEVGDSIEVAWEVTSAAAEHGWEAVGSTLDAVVTAADRIAEQAWDELTEVAESAWEGLSDGIDALWQGIETAGLTAAYWGVAGYEWALDVLERVVYWIGDLGEEIADLIVKLGACLAGQLAFQLAKAANLIASLGKSISQLPTDYVVDLGRLYPGTLQSDVWYVDDVHLVANWFVEGAPTEGMTFAGVTLGGFNISYVIFLSDPWDQRNNHDRELMAHELVHVQQYRRLRFDSVFACAYSIGYVDAGFDYRKNPLEAEAYDFVDVHRQEIDS